MPVDRKQLESILDKTLYELVMKSSTSVPDDVLQKLKEFKQVEIDNPITSSQLKLMIENIEYGNKEKLPICQDTGLVNIFIQLGSNFPIISDFKNLSLNVLKRLTEGSRIRPNTVDPVTQKNNGHNGGANMPPIYLDIIPDNSDIVLTVLNKGGGSENISKLFMLSAATGYDEFIEKIVQTMKEAGGKPCPPIILGIGLGGDAVKSMFLAKKALLRPLGTRNQRKEISLLEEKILEEINQQDIGVMGLGGNSTCLDVRMEWAMRHPASYPVGLIVQCYSHRIVSARISNEGRVEFGKLDENYQFQGEA